MCVCVCVCVVRLGTGSQRTTSILPHGQSNEEHCSKDTNALVAQSLKLHIVSNGLSNTLAFAWDAHHIHGMMPDHQTPCVVTLVPTIGQKLNIIKCFSFHTCAHSYYNSVSERKRSGIDHNHGKLNDEKHAVHYSNCLLYVQYHFAAQATTYTKIKSTQTANVSSLKISRVIGMRGGDPLATLKK